MRRDDVASTFIRRHFTSCARWEHYAYKHPTGTGPRNNIESTLIQCYFKAACLLGKT